MGLFTGIKERWVAETPIFFAKLRNVSITVGGSATAVWAVNSSMSLDLPTFILTGCKYTIAACAACGLTSQLTKTT